MIIKPQIGYQEKVLSCSADIVISGGSAGAGKSFALLIDPLRNVNNPNFNGVFFRRTTPQIRNAGSLWDESQKIYQKLGATQREQALEWEFPSGATLKFSHLEYEKNAMDHQGAQYAFLGFDEITQFTKKQFFFLLSRMRSKTCKPYCRATCNPDPESWVADFISWWIDEKTGFPIPERDGVVRYFTIDSGHYVWGDTKKEVAEKCPSLHEHLTEGVQIDDLIKSITFIRGEIYENKELLKNNPEYLGNLLSQDEETKRRFFLGNWKVSEDDTCLFSFVACKNLFSNFLEKTEKTKKYITCDVARFGSDLAVIQTWEGFEAIRTDIFTKSKLSEIRECIEARRAEFQIPKSNVIVDADGLGGGVVDEGGYSGFVNNATAISPKKSKNLADNFSLQYANLKTQCYYFMADKVNLGLVLINLDNIYVDGHKTKTIKVKSQNYDIEKLIERELRAIKRKDADKDGKKRINDKEDQKILLDGMSPDLADTIMMRAFFELKPEKTFIASNF